MDKILYCLLETLPFHGRMYAPFEAKSYAGRSIAAERFPCIFFVNFEF
jgi:hypothetical protein